jgi:hypothetical protein
MQSDSTWKLWHRGYLPPPRPVKGQEGRSSPEVSGPPDVHRRTDSRTSSGFASPAYDAPSGFLNLLTLFPPFSPVRVFHRTDARGIPPLRRFSPRSGVVPPLEKTEPAWRWQPLKPDAAGAHRTLICSRPPPRLSPPGESETHRNGAAAKSRGSFLPWGFTS